MSRQGHVNDGHCDWCGAELGTAPLRLDGDVFCDFRCAAAYRRVPARGTGMPRGGSDDRRP